MRYFQKLLAPMRRKVASLVTRAVVSLVDDSLQMQGLQIKLLANEVMDGVERFQQYGFTSVPLAGAEGIALSVGGHRSHSVVVNVDDRRFRLKGMAGGEVALYTDEGDVIHFKRGNEIYINAMTQLTAIAPKVNITASTKVTMTTPTCDISGILNVGGNINSAAQISDITGTMQGMRNTFNTHTHPGDSGGVTGSPNQAM